MDLLTLEVDGSLANPYAAAAVVLWTACLSALAIALARGGRTGRHRLGLLVGLFVVGLPITKPAQLLVGNVLYWLADQRITSVGFWGGPPIWIAPVVSFCVGLLAFRSRVASTSSPAG
jgi:hypothetical protein